MDKILVILFPFLLLGCITAKVSHKSEVKANVSVDTQKAADAKIDDQKETHIKEFTVDTAAIIARVKSVETIQIVHDTAYLEAHKSDKPITKTMAVGKGNVKATFYPSTGYFNVTANIPPDTIKVQAHVKETTVTEHKKSNIDSSSNKTKDIKTDVKGSTSVAVSLFSMNYAWAICGLLIGFIIARIIPKTKK